jgi:hypothetical protein
MKKYHGFVNRTATLIRRDETIRHQKREIKSLVRTIEVIEKEKRDDIAFLFADRNKIVSELDQNILDLKEKLASTEAQLKESLRKKWYQFKQVS